MFSCLFCSRRTCIQLLHSFRDNVVCSSSMCFRHVSARLYILYASGMYTASVLCLRRTCILTFLFVCDRTVFTWCMQFATCLYSSLSACDKLVSSSLFYMRQTWIILLYFVRVRSVFRYSYCFLQAYIEIHILFVAGLILVSTFCLRLACIQLQILLATGLYLCRQSVPHSLCERRTFECYFVLGTRQIQACIFWLR